MKHGISLSLYFLVLLGLLLQGVPAGNPLAQSRKSGGVNLSPEAWPTEELDKYWQLQRTYKKPIPAAESNQGMVAVTNEAFRDANLSPSLANAQSYEDSFPRCGYEPSYPELKDHKPASRHDSSAGENFPR